MEEAKVQEVTSRTTTETTKATQPQKRFTKKVMFFTIIVVCLLALLLIAFINHAQKQTMQSSDQSSADTQPTAQWKTYTNTDLHLSFRYPPQFTVIVQKSTDSGDPTITDRVYYSYSFSTGKTVGDGPDWSGFALVTRPAKGQVIQQAFAQIGGASAKITPLTNAQGAEEAADVATDKLMQRAYKTNNKFMTLTQSQYANLLPDKSDDIGPYYESILSTIIFIGS